MSNKKILKKGKYPILKKENRLIPKLLNYRSLAKLKDKYNIGNKTWTLLMSCYKIYNDVKH